MARAWTTGATPGRAAEAPHIQFSNVKLLVPNGKKVDDQDVVISFLPTQVSVVPRRGGPAIATLAYKSIARVTYVHAKDPRWDPAFASPVEAFEVPGSALAMGMRGARHWLVLQSKIGGTFMILRLEDDNATLIMDAVRSRTGLRSSRQAEPPPMLVLNYEEQGVPKTYELPPGKKLIGRLPTSDLPLRDPSVSRHHASLRVVDGRCFVLDAGSRFGTYINGQKIEVETELLPGGTVKLGEISLTLEQKVPEQELLSENHEISDGPGTIYRQLDNAETPSDTTHARLIRLLAEVGQALRRSQSLPDILNRVVDLAFEAVPADRAFLMLRESADEGLTARVLRHRDGSVPPNPTLSRAVVRGDARARRHSRVRCDERSEPRRHRQHPRSTSVRSCVRRSGARTK